MPDNIVEVKIIASGTDEFREAFAKMADETGDKLMDLAVETFSLKEAFDTLREAVNVAAEMETTRVALEAMTGSAEEATEVIEKMEALANKDAIAFPEVLPAAQHMIALGISVQQLPGLMDTAANASWALGGSISSMSERIAFMAISGMAMPRTLRSIGISAEEMAMVLGVSVGDVERAFRGLTVEERANAMKEALKKFSGVAGEEANTMAGQWQILGNKWESILKDLGQDLGPAIVLLEKFANTLADIVLRTEEIAHGSLLSIFGEMGTVLQALDLVTMSLEQKKKQAEADRPGATSAQKFAIMDSVGKSSSPTHTQDQVKANNAKEDAFNTALIRNSTELKAIREKAEAETTAAEDAAKHQKELAAITEATAFKAVHGKVDVNDEHQRRIAEAADALAIAQTLSDAKLAINQREHDQIAGNLAAKSALAARGTMGADGELSHSDVAKEQATIQGEQAGEQARFDKEKLASKQLVAAATDKLNATTATEEEAIRNKNAEGEEALKNAKLEYGRNQLKAKAHNLEIDSQEEQAAMTFATSEAKRFADETQRLGTDAAKQKEVQGEANLDLISKANDAAQQLGMISEREAVKRKHDEIDARYALEMIEIARERELIQGNHSLTAEQKNEQLAGNDAKASAAGNKKGAGNLGASIDQTKKELADVKNFVDPMVHSFDKGINEMIDGTKKFKDAIRDMGRDMLDSFVSSTLEMVAKHYAAELEMWIVHKLFGTTGAATDAALVAARAATVTGPMVLQDAGVAFANAMSYYPPPVAPALAMVAFATTLVGGAPAFSAEGGADLGTGNHLGFLHAREMVLPREHADTIRRMGGQGGGGNSNTVNGGFHYHAPAGEKLTTKKLKGIMAGMDRNSNKVGA